MALTMRFPSVSAADLKGGSGRRDANGLTAAVVPERDERKAALFSRRAAAVVAGL